MKNINKRKYTENYYELICFLEFVVVVFSLI